MIKAYKQDVKTNYILKEPNRSYAYFALFQALGNTLIFNPRSDKDDIKALRCRRYQAGHLLSRF